MASQKEKSERRDLRKLFEEIIAENFPNIGKEIFNQVQEAQRVQGRINLRKNTLRHMVIKMSKLNTKIKY